MNTTIKFSRTERREKVRKKEQYCWSSFANQSIFKRKPRVMLLQGRPTEISSKAYYPCKNGLKGPALGSFADRFSVLSGDTVTRCSSDKEATTLQVHPFLTPNKARRAMTVNFSEIFNKLSYSRQMEKHQEK